ncbi:MAG: TolC family protein [Balneolaceae bacterium]|nr:TolC family protein [Balneolaceae bacterium]
MFIIKASYLILLCFPAILAGRPVSAQVIGEDGTTSTVLQHYLRIARQNNLELINRQLDTEHARAGLRRSRALFYPDLELNATYDLSEGGRTIDIPVGDLLNPVNRSLNRVTGQNRLPTDLQNVSEPILNDQFHETKLRITQPLFNTDLYYNYRAQKELLTAREAQKQAVVNELTREVKVAYYNYLKSEELLKIRDSTMVLLQELLQFNRNLVKHKKATRDAVSGARYEISKLESKRAETVTMRNNARSLFNFLLNRPLDTVIEKDTTLQTPPPLAELEVLREEALRQREDLHQLEATIGAQQNQLKLQKSDVWPELFLVGDVGYQGFGYEFDRDQQFWFLRFGLRWDLFRGFQNRAEIDQSRIRVKKLENRFENLKNQIRLKVINTYENYRSAQADYRAAISAEKHAEDRYRIIRNKYRQNRVLLIEYLDARTSYTSARLEKVIARYTLLARYAELEQAVARY